MLATDPYLPALPRLSAAPGDAPCFAALVGFVASDPQVAEIRLGAETVAFAIL